MRSDLKGAGLGEILLRKLIDHLRARGTQWLVATVLVENTRMLDLARKVGVAIDEPVPGEDVRAIRLQLATG